MSMLERENFCLSLNFSYFFTSRSIASKVESDLQIKSTFTRPELNLDALVTSRVDALQEVSSLSEREEGESQKGKLC